MLIDVKVPVLAESVAEATLMSWQKQPGDHISRGDTLIDIETDKVTLEVAAPNDGVMVEILKGDGESVDSDEIIARIDTGAKAGATASEPATEPEQQSLPVDTQQPEQQQQPQLSPAVRALLAEHALDAAVIPSSRVDGRLTKEDVLNYLQQQDKSGSAGATAATPPPADTQVSAAAAPAAAPAPEHPATIEPRAVTPAPETADKPAAAGGERPQQRVPMTRLRKRTAERLLSAQKENAILTTFNEVDMQPLMKLRARYKDAFEQRHGTRLGFMSFFTKASVEALKRFPAVNASIDGDDILYHGYFDIGIAVGSPRGLVVPIVRDADLLSFANIESAIRDFGRRAQDGKLTIDELTGGTFTITNGGTFGSLLSTPILNPPQSAILGMHKIQERPVADNGNVVIRPMMYLALSYDHRIIDGREAVQFLVAIKELVEDPARLLLEV